MNDGSREAGEESPHSCTLVAMIARLMQFRLVRRLSRLVLRPYTRDELMAISGNVSVEWLRAHPRAAKAAGYILDVDGKLLL